MQTAPSIAAPEEGDEQDVPFFQRMTHEEARQLHGLAESNAGAGFVAAPPGFARSAFARLRLAGLVETRDALGRVEVMLTAQGVAALPHALKVIAAGPAMGAP